MLVAGLTACKPRDAGTHAESTPAATIKESTTASATLKSGDGQAPSTSPATGNAEQSQGQSQTPWRSSFKLDSVPISAAPVGEFPFIHLLDGFKARKSVTMDFARYPFWVNDGEAWVDGKFYQISFGRNDGKKYPTDALQGAIEDQIKRLGGQRLWQGRIPSDARNTWGDEYDLGFIVGRGGVANDTANTYLIRRTDGNIWIHLVNSSYSDGSSSSSSMVIGQQQPFTATAMPLDIFPHFALPAGYERRNEATKDFARFPFWIDGKPDWVEGKFYQSRIAPSEGKIYSLYEVQRDIEQQVQQLGGQKLWEGKIPSGEAEKWGKEITQGFHGGLGDIYNEKARIYKIPRDDGDIWLHLLLNTNGANYVVGKEARFEPSAELVPATDLKQQMDRDGKVALQVNFATDKTEILPDSLPQIDEVVKLLQQDPQLKVAVSGHTDNSGNKAHNQTLSEGRAKSVVAAITAKGVDASRLQAAGFGDSQPVADNGSEEGKAKNRRVELVKN